MYTNMKDLQQFITVSYIVIQIIQQNQLITMTRMSMSRSSCNQDSRFTMNTVSVSPPDQDL